MSLAESAGGLPTGTGLVELGQTCLRERDFAGAIRYLEDALKLPGSDALDAHLLLAEALWGSGGGSTALPHYEAAAALAAEAGNTSKQGMIAVGFGFALKTLGRPAEARERFLHARQLAEADGNAGAVRFVTSLLEQIQSETLPAQGERDTIQTTWRQFSESVAAGEPAVLFLKGSFASPADLAGRRGVTKLRAAGAANVRAIDVSSRSADIPEGLQTLSDSPHLPFPQLFVSGAEVTDWLDATPEKLRDLLGRAGVQLVEPHVEACHGSDAFTDGLEPWEAALVQLVSKLGAGSWQEVAENMCNQGFGAPSLGDSSPEMFERAWQRLLPSIRDKLAGQPEMPCGHSCDTCPTRHDCQLHSAVESARDIEDLA